MKYSDGKLFLSMAFAAICWGLYSNNDAFIQFGAVVMGILIFAIKERESQ